MPSLDEADSKTFSTCCQIECSLLNGPGSSIISEEISLSSLLQECIRRCRDFESDERRLKAELVALRAENGALLKERLLAAEEKPQKKDVGTQHTEDFASSFVCKEEVEVQRKISGKEGAGATNGRLKKLLKKKTPSVPSVPGANDRGSLVFGPAPGLPAVTPDAKTVPNARTGEDKNQQRYLPELPAVTPDAITGEDVEPQHATPNVGYNKCKNKLCAVCERNLLPGGSTSIPASFGLPVDITLPNFSCSTKNMIYLTGVVVEGCKKFYVGETKQMARVRWAKHNPIPGDRLDEPVRLKGGKPQYVVPGTRIPESCNSAVRLHGAKYQGGRKWWAAVVEVLPPETSTLVRKQKEEEWIARLNPELNVEQSKLNRQQAAARRAKLKAVEEHFNSVKDSEDD